MTDRQIFIRRELSPFLDIYKKVNKMEESVVKQNESEIDKSNIDSNELKVSKEPSTRIEIKNPTTDRKVGRMSLR